MDVGGWLRSLGLGKYEAAFRENEIDETVLPSLTHEILKELGFTAIGHRLKLLDAIAALRVASRAVFGPYRPYPAAVVPSPVGIALQWITGCGGLALCIVARCAPRESSTWL